MAMSIPKVIPIGTVQAESERNVQRFARLFRAALDRIPKDDRQAMSAKLETLTHRICSSSEWRQISVWRNVLNSSAFYDSHDNSLNLHATIFECSDDERALGVIGHELGHVRAGSHDCVSQPCQVCEDMVFEYALDKWGFPDAQNVHKSPTCDRLDAHARRRGLHGQVFGTLGIDLADRTLKRYYYLPPGQQLTVNPFDLSIRENWSRNLESSIERARRKLDFLAEVGVDNW